MANRKPQFSDLLAPDGVVCPTPEATAELGASLAEDLDASSVLSLEGPLGAGKTQFVKGLTKALGYEGAVSSPSFALLHEYETQSGTLYHFDFYRMESAEELQNCGYDDCLADGIVVAEWGDKFLAALPAGTLRLQFEILPDGGRCIRGSEAP